MFWKRDAPRSGFIINKWSSENIPIRLFHIPFELMEIINIAEDVGVGLRFGCEEDLGAEDVH